MNTFHTNTEGYLLDAAAWQPNFAEQVATQKGITLTEQHWVILNFARTFYQTHGFSPGIKILLLALRKTVDPALDSITLQQLFAHQPARLISQLAGLPKPKDCV